ncbi:hypothetical protein [Actinoplanes sp. RD1]|uniref:hypothetical protein n=1 Tax=Actinoplanes sp. RD1 TaxID=3064538 RepID=UPI00274150FD|nr:hypothetical protein [Actinoplanes sp. RD1]
MSESMGRRRLLRTGVAGLTGVATAAVAAPMLGAEPAAAAGSIVQAPLPVGNWLAIVTFVDPPGTVERNLFTFAYDGTFAHAGGASVTGLGWWRPAAGNGFRYGWRHFAFDGDTYVFMVEGAQTAVLNGKTFTSQGTGKAIDDNGTVLFTVTTQVSATWYGPA